jgi:hypothetical protein
VGPYAIVPSGLTSTNYALAYTNGTLTVTQSVLTVAVDDRQRGYGDANPALTGTLSGVVNQDDLTATYATLATSASASGTYPIAPVWGDPDGRLGNYAVVTNLGTLTVTQAVLTVTADDQTRLYGQTNPPLTLVYRGFVNGDEANALTAEPVCTTAAGAGFCLGRYPIVPAGGVASNYLFTYVDGTLTITPAPLAVTAGSYSRSYGLPNPAYTGSVTGLVNGDVVPVGYTCAALTNTAPGIYPVVPALSAPAGVATNYSVTLNPGALTITADDPPVITLSQEPWLHTVGADPLYLEFMGLMEGKLMDTNALVSDGGSAHFHGGTLAVTLSEHGNGADQLRLVPGDSGAGQVDLLDGVVTFGGVACGTLAGGTNGAALAFSFNSNATPAVVQALVRRLAFDTTDESTDSRTVCLVLADGSGGVSEPACRVLGLNRPPNAATDPLLVRSGAATAISIPWILGNDTDADSDPVTLATFSSLSANGGRVYQAGTNLVYIPAANFAGADLFAYLVADGRGGEGFGIIGLTVLRQNTLSLDLNQMQAAGVRVQMGGIPGRTYRIETTTDLGQWTLLTTVVANAQGVIDVVDTAARSSDRRFYRAVAE